ncbi:hypothetical protein [Methanoregula sp.]|uniref:hypothetical protein n=1 Tax=Methanoregula sp. TaxID=2052170 RepID=UPI002CBF8AA7|nr:hypothetical protein [Methanoregula sp.]HVP96044.1 hypothetical protein [Methanoregula sp.]
MSAGILDWVISLLLVVAAGFGAISVIGLLLFPDIRSRSFTGIRAGILAIALVTIASVCYGLFKWSNTGDLQYPLFILGALIMLALVIVLNRIATGVVCHSSMPAQPPSPGAEDRH